MLLGMPLGKHFEHKLETSRIGMYEFTMVNSYVTLHIMMQFLMTHGPKNIYLHEVNIVHHNS